MKDEEKWMELSGQAANQQDPQRPMELSMEINRLFEAKERRLLGDLPDEDSAR
jgi:hypothetical protein